MDRRPLNPAQERAALERSFVSGADTNERYPRPKECLLLESCRKGKPSPCQPLRQGMPPRRIEAPREIPLGSMRWHGVRA